MPGQVKFPGDYWGARIMAEKILRNRMQFSVNLCVRLKMNSCNSACWQL